MFALTRNTVLCGWKPQALPSCHCTLSLPSMFSQCSQLLSSWGWAWEEEQDGALWGGFYPTLLMKKLREEPRFEPRKSEFYPGGMSSVPLRWG